MASLSVNQAFAQCPTSLTLGAYPNKGTVGFQTNTLPVSLSGQLKTCGEGMGNTIITITGIDDSDKEVPCRLTQPIWLGLHRLFICDRLALL